MGIITSNTLQESIPSTPVFASLRQPLLGAHRPLTSFGSGVPSASTFSESLADADDAALERLVIIFTVIITLRRSPFESVSILFFHFRSHKNAPFSGHISHFTLRVHKKALFYGQHHHFDVRIHKNSPFHGQKRPHAPNERSVSDGSQMVMKKPLRRVA